MKQDNFHHTPLADRIRPETLDDFFGQVNLVGENSYLKKAIESDSVPSMILWGPPRFGKNYTGENHRPGDEVPAKITPP